MSKTVADFLLERMREWGIERIYGYPGDGINGILGALNRAGNRPELIHVRHEEMSAFMACAHAKFTGELGVCLATSGPGAAHLLTGLYDAKMDHQPVLAIVGQQARSSLGSDYQQEVDLISLFKDVAHEYVQMLTVPAQLPEVIDRAIRIALDQKTVTCVIVPNDLQEQDAVEPGDIPRAHGFVTSGVGYKRPRVIPEEEDLRAAAEVLNSGQKVAMLIGAGALGASEEVEQVADILGCGVAKALLGRAALPDDLPYVTGAIGLLGSKPSWDMIMECDTLFMVGTSFPYAELLPPVGQARAVQIDINGRKLGIRYPTEVNLVGDARATLRELIPLLERKQDRSWREKIEREVSRWWEVVEAQAMDPANPINPQRVFWELSSRLPDHCILAADSGSSADWFARFLKLRRGMMASSRATWRPWARAFRTSSRPSSPTRTGFP